jgi:hypothetical protein
VTVNKNEVKDRLLKKEAKNKKRQPNKKGSG